MDGQATHIAHSVRPVRVRKRPPMDMRVARWIERTFVIPSGQNEGQPFKLHEFQRDFLRGYLSRDTDGPTFRTCVLSTPRKLGKSTFLGVLCLAHMLPDSPLYKANFMGAIAAPTEKHAGYISKAMQALLEAIGRGDEFKTKANPRPGLVLVGGGTLILSTGARGQGHGADLDLALIDETGLIASVNDGLLQGFFDALSARNGQLILTGTRGDAHEYNEMIDHPDKRTFVALFGADKQDDPADPAVWDKANPDGGAIKPRRFLQDAYDKAESSGSVAEFQAWQLNVPLSPSRELLLTYDELSGSYKDDPKPIPGEPVHLGIDLGGAASMTACTIAYETSGLIKVVGAFPGADMDLRTRGKRDAVGDLWHRCAKAGELIETSGSVSDLAEFLPEVIQRVGAHPVRSVSCDRYRQHEFETALARGRISWPVVYRGTGPKDGDNDIRATRRLFKAGAVSMHRSLLLEGSLAEADVKVSTTGACQLAKSHLHARIDVAQSLVLACAALLRARDAVPTEYTVEVL